VLERAQEALHRYGTGCTGSRFLNGTLDMHEELETRLARFMGQEACLVFSTGYQTNLGMIATLAGRGSVVLQDRLNHASLVDAALLSGGQMVRYSHGDLGDAPAAPREALGRRWRGPHRHRRGLLNGGRHRRSAGDPLARP
jgi:8-amino-7-oxononanoate synthase